MENSSVKPLTRRDFLKLSGAVGGKILLDPLLPKEKEITSPLSQEQFNELIKRENQKVIPEKKPGIYDVTLVVPTSADKKIYQETRETSKQFLKRHIAAFNRLLIDGEIPTSVRLHLQRVTIVEDNVVPPSSNDPSWVNTGFKDSDGLYNLDTNYQLLRPETLNFFVNPKTKIDYGILHELGHRVLLFPDLYALDSQNNYDHPILNKMPENYRAYMTYLRNDRTGGLMTGGNEPNFKIDRYMSLMLNKRLTDRSSHEFQTLLETQFEGFAHIWPNKMIFLPLSPTGDRLNFNQMDVYRTIGTGHGYDKQFARDSLLSLQAYGSTVSLSGEQLLGKGNDKIVSETQGTLLFVFKNKNEPTHYRFMDVVDFSEAELLNPAKDFYKITFRTLPLNPNFNLPIDKFDWTVAINK